MTGEEFLQKVREIKEISNIRWDVKGFCLNADEVYIQITTDKEEFSLWLGNPAECKGKADLLDSTWQNRTAVCLLLNKAMMLQNRLESFNVECGLNLSTAINFVIQCIKDGQRCVTVSTRDLSLKEDR